MFLWVRMTVGQAEQIPLSIVTQTITGEKVKKKKNVDSPWEPFNGR